VKNENNPDFVIGSTFEHAGCLYRVLAGNRCAGDKVIEISLDGGSSWWRPPIAHGIIMYEFKSEVEENNYPWPTGRGRYKLKDAYEGAIEQGWRSEAAKIDEERRAKSEVKATNDKAGFVGYDKDGHFVHYCHCGQWGAFSVGSSLLHDKLGTWYCLEHRPPPISSEGKLL
jgi:hypothetical protein